MRKSYWIVAVVAVITACSVFAAAKYPKYGSSFNPTVALAAKAFRQGIQAADNKVSSPSTPHTCATPPTQSSQGSVEECTIPEAAPEVVAVARPEMPSHIIVERSCEPCVAYPGCEAHCDAVLGRCVESNGPCTAAVCGMPYCSDPKPCTQAMPYADEAVSCPKDSTIFEFWLGQVAAEDKSETSEVKYEVVPLPVDPTEVEDMEEPQAQEDPHHNHHNSHQDYIVCPYSGRCYPREAQPTTPSEKPMDVKTEEEKTEEIKIEVDQCKKPVSADAKCTCKEKGVCCENCQCEGKCKCCKEGDSADCKCKEKQKTSKPIKGIGEVEEQEDTPKLNVPQIDTMEFRPSDAIPFSIFPGPF